jgi:type IV secretory pathway VirJ component
MVLSPPSIIPDLLLNDKSENGILPNMKMRDTFLYAITVFFFSACFLQTAETPPRGSADDTKGFPIVEVPAPPSSRDDLALVLSGDGGWAGLDRKIAELLSVKNGISVVGFNSLLYFLSRRTPEGTASDVERILRHYSTLWGKQRIVLIGYSFGADVLPFVVSRLPADLSAAVELVVFISLGHSIDFKFGLSDWFGGKSKATEMETVPEVEKLRGMKILCFYGIDDKDKPCASGELDFVTAIPLRGGHGIHGDGEDVVAAIMRLLE